MNIDFTNNLDTISKFIRQKLYRDLASDKRLYLDINNALRTLVAEKCQTILARQNDRIVGFICYEIDTSRLNKATAKYNPHTRLIT